MIIHKGTSSIQNLEDVRECVGKTSFPAQKKEIFQEALRKGVNMNVLTLIQSLPDKLFSNPRQVFKQFGLSWKGGNYGAI